MKKKVLKHISSQFVSGTIALILILLFSFALRVYGINWDSNQHLNPDERFLTMVGTAATVPGSFLEYLNPKVSSLNPYNLGDFHFFVYGTLPLTLTKLAAVTYDMDSYNGLVIMGRLLSSLADIGTLIWVFLTASLFQKHRKLHITFPYISAAMYGIAVLPIQYSHFFTTDSFSVFFSMGAFYWSLRYSFVKKRVIRHAILAGIFLGLGLGTKISTVFLIPLYAGLFLIPVWENRRQLHKNLRMIMSLFAAGVLSFLFAYVALRLADPRMFETMSWLNPTLNPQFVGNITELRYLMSPEAVFPPSVQWLHAPSLLFPLYNLVLFGVGLPFFIASCIGFLLFLHDKKATSLVIVLWVCFFFIYQGTRHVLAMRYFYILYPFLALFAARAITAPTSYMTKDRIATWLMPMFFAMMIWPMSFIAIYTRPHTYVSASEWVYNNVPTGSMIVQEHWNDYLPVNFPPEHEKPARNSQEYVIEDLNVFDIDTSSKISTIREQVSRADYYIIPNNRSYGSMKNAPEAYPYMNELYDELFSGELGYELVAEFTSYPTINLGFTEVYIPDQWAEESFTVYDHPRVLIFQNMRK